MPIYNFGVGNMVAVRTDIANATPTRFGVLQDVQVSFDGTLKELIGQYQFPVDVARGQVKVMGKAKFARIVASAFNDLFFGQTITSGASIGEQLAVDVAGTIPTTPYQITPTVPGSGTWAADAGVFFKATGVQLTLVASGPTTGQYSVAAGVYTFAAADTTLAVLISYRYTAGAGSTYKYLTITNQLMGQSPTFVIELQQNYTNNGGTAGTPFMRFNACKSSKFDLPMKNTDYTLIGFDFQAFADASGTIAEMTFNE